MKMKHLLIEGYCDGKEIKKMHPCKNTLELGIHCLNCPQFSYTYCPNEIAVSNEWGIVEKQEDFIGFGAEMESDSSENRQNYISMWRKICREKISEAYMEYMDKIS